MTDDQRRAALRAILRSGPAALSRPGALAGAAPRAQTPAPPAVPAARPPLIEVFDEGDEIVVVAEIPGLSLASLRPALAGRTLTLGPTSVELPCEAQLPPRSVEIRNGILGVRLVKLMERAVG